MSDIKGIVFDKDGTIIDFYTLWLPMVERTAEKIIAEFTPVDPRASEYERLEAGIMDIFGLDTDDSYIDPDGNLAQATVDRSARQLTDYLLEQDFQIGRSREELEDRIYGIMENSVDEIDYTKNLRETADLHELFSELSERGYRLGLATADTRPSTLTIMKELDITDYFDYIACGDDEMPDKPDPAVLEDFCSEMSLECPEVAMVGDTPTDLKTGRRAGAGLVVGVLCGVGSREDLEELADELIETPERILDII